MNHKITLHGVILMSGILSFAVLIHETNGIITDSNKLDCTDIQCPINCPADSFLQTADNNFEEDDEDEDYVEELMTPEPYNEVNGHFEELPPEVEVHDSHTQHAIKERQKREVFFQDDIDRCCDDQICVCHKCPNVPKCSSQEVAVEVKEGQGKPGNCCSTYKCVEKVTCSAGVKQSWWNNKCIKCSCFGDNEICEQLCAEEEVIQNCYSEYWQKPMMNGVSWKEGGCTSCTCEQGEKSCLTPVCPKLECEKTVMLEDECCAKCVDMPNISQIELTTGKDNLVNKTTPMVALTEESSTQLSQVENTTQVNNSSSLHDNVNSIDLENSSKNDSTTTTQLPLIMVVNTTSTPVSITESSSSVSSIESSTEAKNTSTLNDDKIIMVKETEATTTETTPINETTISDYNKNKTIIPIEDSSSTSVNVEESSESSTYSSTSETATSSMLAETTTSSSIGSSTDISNLTASTYEITTEESLTKLINDDESSTVESSSSETISSSMPTLINITEIEELTTVASLVNSTTENNVVADNSEETETEESTTNIPAQEIVTSTTTTTSTTTDSTTPAKLTEPTTQDPSTTTSTTSQTTSSVTFDSTTPEKISSTKVPKTNNISSTNKPIDSSTSTTTTTSTTSSPYTATTETASSSEESSTTSSTTSAPEPIEPFFQSFGDNATVDTQQQMRGMFDQIDYVVMIVLFIGALLCIALGLIIRHTKNRKKMYSSIPNSETSLSQTSTNTMMTV